MDRRVILVVVTPSPGEPPAISSDGQVLQEDDRVVNTAPSNAACTALITAGALGDCGEVAVAGQRVVWAVEQATTPTGFGDGGHHPGPALAAVTD